MSRQSNKQMFLKIIIALLLVSPVIYIISLPDWNSYWNQRFESKQCENVCLNRNMSLAWEDPTYCYCSNPKITEKNYYPDGIVRELPIQVSIRRPWGFKDNLIGVFR